LYLTRGQEDEAGRSHIQGVRCRRQDSPLKFHDGVSGTQTCVWPRIVTVKHFRHIFVGTNPLELLPPLLQSFSVTRAYVVHRLHFECSVLRFYIQDNLATTSMSAVSPKGRSEQNIVFIQQNWVEKINMLLYLMGNLLTSNILISIPCETWSLTLREEHRLRVFENRVLRRIFGPKRDEVTGEWRKLHNEELHDL
jgi:hypothetical protein